MNVTRTLLFISPACPSERGRENLRPAASSGSNPAFWWTQQYYSNAYSVSEPFRMRIMYWFRWQIESCSRNFIPIRFICCSLPHRSVSASGNASRIQVRGNETMPPTCPIFSDSSVNWLRQIQFCPCIQSPATPPEHIVCRLHSTGCKEKWSPLTCVGGVLCTLSRSVTFFSHVKRIFKRPKSAKRMKKNSKWHDTTAKTNTNQ